MSIIFQITDTDLCEIAYHINADSDTGEPIDADALIKFVQENNLYLHDEVQALILKGVRSCPT